MSLISTRSRALVLGVACAAGGVGAGAIATAGAATSSAHQGKTHHARRAEHARLRELSRHAVAGSVVVHTKAGFETVTFERGTVDAVSGDQITITEGTGKDAYKKTTVTIPAGARVRDNGKRSSLSSVSAGQRVLIAQLPKHAIVRAHTPKQH
jgi:hypothetical protein